MAEDNMNKIIASMNAWLKSGDKRKVKTANIFFYQFNHAMSKGKTRDEALKIAYEKVKNNIQYHLNLSKTKATPGIGEEYVEKKVELPPGMKPIEVKAVGKGEYKIEETTQGQQSQKEPQEAVTPGELGLGTGFAYSYAF
ncbi:MAG: hypothetical protein J7K31_02180, partial [Candidatus Aenigmarchaeota archaeon]|nr:hypothetical protein [Candidatus Aenigmarchaeota archaeon]